MSETKHMVQIAGEIGGLLSNFFFIYLLWKYFNVFNRLEKGILIFYIIGTFLIEPYLLSTWTSDNWQQFELFAKSSIKKLTSGY